MWWDLDYFFHINNLNPITFDDFIFYKKNYKKNVIIYRLTMLLKILEYNYLVFSGIKKISVKKNKKRLELISYGAHDYTIIFL